MIWRSCSKKLRAAFQCIAQALMALQVFSVIKIDEFMVVVLSRQVLTKLKSQHGTQSCQLSKFSEGSWWRSSSCLSHPKYLSCPAVGRKGGARKGILGGDQSDGYLNWFLERGVHLVFWDVLKCCPFCYIACISWFALLRHTVEVQMLVSHLTPSYTLYSAVLSVTSM